MHARVKPDAAVDATGAAAVEAVKREGAGAAAGWLTGAVLVGAGVAR